MRMQLVSFCFVLTQLAASELWVAPNGSDSTGTGSQTQPWSTLQKAANSAPAGSVIHVENGAYSPFSIRRSGLRFIAVNARGPVIDGSAIVPGDGSTQLINVQGVSDVEVDGFVVRNLTTTANSAGVRYLDGIQIGGGGQRIAIRNCLISGIQNKHPDPLRRQAHGLIVYASSPMTDITISGNEITGCILGYSETLTLNGDIDRFSVEDNHIHDNDNIGIDIAGGYGASRVNDYARNGIVQRNNVQRCTSAANPAYNGALAAAGIYIDGGWNTVVERNRVEGCDFGMSISAENLAWTAQGNTVRNNLVLNNKTAGLNLGGAAPGQNGLAINNLILHNTFYNNALGNGLGEIFFANAHSNTLTGNIFCSTGGYIYAVYSPATYASSGRNVCDSNIHWSTTGAPRYAWYDTNYVGLAAFRQASSAQGSIKDGNTSAINPGFVNIAGGNAQLSATSGARDLGSLASDAQAGTIDFSGAARLSGSARDRGAFEYVAVTIPVPNTQSPFGGTAVTLPGRIVASAYDLGGESVAYHDEDATNNGGALRTDGVDVETSSEGGTNVGYIAAGEWLEYTVNVRAGTYALLARVAAPAAGGSLKVLLDGVSLGTITVPATGGWQQWQTVTLPNVAVAGGNGRIVRVEIVTGGFNLATLDVNEVVSVSGWSTTNIGAVGLVGSTTVTNGIWTIKGSGADIWNNADAFTFESRSVTGDVQITAQVTTLANTDQWAKAGVMIRDSMAPGAMHFSTFVTPVNGACCQRRVAINSASIHTAGARVAAPYWVRCERMGNTLISSTSVNGTTWNEIRRETITMGATLNVGLAVTSHNNGQLTTATFANVSVITAPRAAN